jgi:ParB/Sulfiredoxin domain/DNA methylase
MVRMRKYWREEHGQQTKNAVAGHIAIVYRPTAELRLDPRNPRAHSKRQVRQIADSLKTFGFLVPVVIDRKRNVIAGHGRIMAPLFLGMTDVPTICAEHLNEAQLQAFMIADNRLTKISVWDERLLAEQLKELSLQEPDFDLEVTGFHTGEIDLRIGELAQEAQDRPDPADALPAPRAEPPVTQPGDLWLLDKHRAYCGSALEHRTFDIIMRGSKATMAFIDPPYNVRIAGNVSGLGANHHREFVMASGEMDEAEFTQFLRRAFTQLANNTVNGSVHFACMDWRHLQEILSASRQVYDQLLNVCVWAKDNAGMGSLYRSQHELIFVFKNGRGPRRNNVQLGRFGRNRTNVWRYPGANSFSRAGDDAGFLRDHPTPKPTNFGRRRHHGLHAAG